MSTDQAPRRRQHLDGHQVGAVSGGTTDVAVPAGRRPAAGELVGPTRTARRGSRYAALRFAVLVALIAGLSLAMLVLRPSRGELIDVVRHSTLFGPLVVVLGSAALITALAPRTLLAAAGGALFGTTAGSVYVVAGVTVGAIIAFLVGRLMGREYVAARLGGRLAGGRLALVEQAVCRYGIVAVLITRLVPAVPFGVANYIFGTTGVRRVTFVLGTAVGVVPATVAYAALGAAAMRGDGHGVMVATGVVLALGTAGSIGSYLIWRRRPRKNPAAADAAGSGSTARRGRRRLRAPVPARARARG